MRLTLFAEIYTRCDGESENCKQYPKAVCREIVVTVTHAYAFNNFNWVRYAVVRFHAPNLHPVTPLDTFNDLYVVHGVGFRIDVTRLQHAVCSVICNRIVHVFHARLRNGYKLHLFARANAKREREKKNQLSHRYLYSL